MARGKRTMSQHTYIHIVLYSSYEVMLMNPGCLRPDFLCSLVYNNFFQRSNVEGRNKNKHKMSQNKDITRSNDKLNLQNCIL